MIALSKPFWASELAQSCGGVLHGPDQRFSFVAPAETANENCLSFAMDARPSLAGVLLCREPRAGCSVVVADPLLVLAGFLSQCFPEAPWEGQQQATGAWVSTQAKVADDARLFPGVVVGAGCEVGAKTVLFPNVVLQPGVRIGRNCRIHAGTVVGADGFRYHAGPRGPVKVPQVGGVVIGNDVEIGAACTIDRGFLDDTRIGDGCKLDNQVHIGHNCRLGRFVIIAAQSGLSGSCVLGDGVMLGGQVGLADHTEIGAGAKIGAQSGLHGRIPAGQTWLGTPALPIHVMRRVYAVSRHLPEMWRKLGRSD